MNYYAIHGMIAFGILMNVDQMEELIIYVTTKQLSCVPFNLLHGLSSFSKGNIFDGCCEVINTVMAVISLSIPLYYTRQINDDIAACNAGVTIILDLGKFYHITISGPANR